MITSHTPRHVGGQHFTTEPTTTQLAAAFLLELANVFSLAAQKPRRSILFTAVTAEEQGLLGSEYLGKTSPTPADKIALDLNYDDVPPLGSPEEVEVSGSEAHDVLSIVQALAKEFRLNIRPDARPEAGHYYRSDHFSLARVGIPAFSVNEGMKYKGHDVAWGMQQADEFTAKHYHQPSDEYQSRDGFHRRRGDGAFRFLPWGGRPPICRIWWDGKRGTSSRRRV